MNIMYVDCRVAMYKEEAVRVLAILDLQNDTLAISNVMPYHPPKKPFDGKTPEQIEKIKMVQKNSIIVVDNIDAFDRWDLAFDEQEHLNEAVRSYYLLNANKTLVLKEDALRMYSPEGVIQIRKMELTGNQYELDSESITNGHVAVLLCCWAAVKMRNTASLLSESDPSEEDDEDFLVPFSV